MNSEAVMKADAQMPSVPMDVSVGALEATLALGDLSKLSSADRLKYMAAICATVGLNPLTKPFDYITLDGRLTLYANKGCAEQLRRLHGVSVQIAERLFDNGCLIVRVTATTKDGRIDEATGVVSTLYPERYKDPRDGQWKEHPKAGKSLTGPEFANAVMKAETKAKRRVTLSICGLGILDESELETVPKRERPTDIADAETASDRAKRLNDALTAPKAIDVESERGASEASEPHKLAEADSTPAPATNLASTQATAAQPSPVPPPSGPAVPAGRLPAETVRDLEFTLGDEIAKAIDWMKAKGWLTQAQIQEAAQAGENPFVFLTEIQARKILKQTDSFLRAIQPQPSAKAA